MHFGTKNYLKSNRNHTAKQTLTTIRRWIQKKRNRALKNNPSFGLVVDFGAIKLKKIDQDKAWLFFT